jgi:hypothetical protein
MLWYHTGKLEVYRSLPEGRGFKIPPRGFALPVSLLQPSTLVQLDSSEI